MNSENALEFRKFPVFYRMEDVANQHEQNIP